jgi:thiamine biosynthesis lipoprotein
MVKPSTVGKKLNFIFLTILFGAAFSCQQSSTRSNSFVSVEGQTMGTTYHIKFEDQEAYLNYQFEIDSVLIDVNDALSHYIGHSVISQFNEADSTFSIEKVPATERQRLLNQYFMKNYFKSIEVWKLTKGAFDPTVGPMVNYWGFGSDGRKEIGQVDTSEFNQMMQLVGFEKIKMIETMAAFNFTKKMPGIKLDFSAIAKGFGIDEVCRLLEEQGVQNYMVEIGGEVSCKGFNSKGKQWKIGISKPDSEAMINTFFATLELSEEAMASSGNYRNFYIKDGIKRFHSINPRTGFPEENNLRSATVIAQDCMTADALATACMVMGFEKAQSLVYTIDGVKAFLIYEDEAGKFDYFATTGVNFKLIQ